MLDLAHVTQAVLVDPALDRVEPLYAFFPGDPRAVRRRDLLREGASYDDFVESLVVEGGEPLLGFVENGALVVAEGRVVSDALSGHLLDGAGLAVVWDGEPDAARPRLVPGRRGTAEQGDRAVLDVGE